MDKIAVAALVAAWIETDTSGQESGKKSVAALVAAWIETISTPGAFTATASQPLWLRGLKQKKRVTLLI